MDNYNNKNEKDFNSKINKNFQSLPYLNKKKIDILDENLKEKESAMSDAKILNFSMKNAQFDTNNYFSIEEINKSKFLF